MGRKAEELKALQVAELKAPGMHFVGGVAGLALYVSETGGRSWILRVMVGGKRRDMGLGGYPDVRLAQAHAAAREARAKIRSGIDPIEESRAARSVLMASRMSALTFEQCTIEYIGMKEKEWTNPKHAQQWRNTLATYAFPVIGKLLVRDVELPHIRSVLDPIWEIKTETATRLRGRIESVLDWATVSGYRSGLNPARWKGHLDKLLTAPGKIAKIEHHAALPFVEIGAFMVNLRKNEGMGARALEFAILCASRSGEVRGAAWSEIDSAGRVWTVPAERMKMKTEHRVPLTDEALTLLKSIPRVEGTDLVFPNTKGTALSDMTLTAVLRRMGVAVTAHGFRSTFMDWASESTNYDSNTREMALAHAIGDKVEAAYRRGDLFEKRTRLMQDWSRFCGRVGTADNVVAINAKAA